MLHFWEDEGQGAEGEKQEEEMQKNVWDLALKTVTSRWLYNLLHVSRLLAGRYTDNTTL